MNDRAAVQLHTADPQAEPLFVRRQLEQRRTGAGGWVTHSFAALGFCTGGSSSHEQSGRWSVREGDVLLVPAGAAHRSLSAQGARLWCAGLTPSCLHAEGQAELLEPFERVRSGGAAVVSIPGERHEFVQQLFVELERELATKQAGHQRARNGLLTLLINEITRARAGDEAESRGALCASDDVVSASLRFIEQNCLGPLSLRDVAGAVHRSPAHLATMLKRATGQTVGAWILDGRMAEARRRLGHSDELVEVIAERVGYADPTHFTRLFRRVHGVTPSVYRAQHRARARG